MRQSAWPLAKKPYVWRAFIGALSLCALSLTAPELRAQDAVKASFSPVKYVNNQAITGYELSQRMAFLKLLGFDGDLRGEAISGLIDDRLRQSTAKAMGLSLTSDQIMAGMEEFASRGSLNAQDFVKAIGEQGIAPETFRDFVSAGLIWRDVISKKYGDSVNISDAAVTRALTNLQVGAAQSVTMAEIVLDASDANRNKALALARDLQIDFIKGRSFSDAARAVSVGATARSGGALPAKRLSELPQDIAVLVRGLQPGQVSTPIILDGKLYIYQMIENASVAIGKTGPKRVDFAEIALGGGDGAQAVADLRAHVDSCDDLYSYAKDHGLSVSRRSEGAGGTGVLQSLDLGEIAGPLGGASGQMAVMLCARGLDPTQTASRDEVKLLLKNQRLAALADVYLSELRADALIRDP